MGKRIDLTGQRFGRLTVIEYYGKKKHGDAIWKCTCDCGKTTYKTGKVLRNGESRSCGCINRENLIKRNTKHNMSKTKLHMVWCTMKQRCTNENSKKYINYGGRGIAICEEWNDFTNFMKWANDNGYKEGLSIDRIDVNGNYEPNNCRWADVEQQANNKTTSRYLTIDGVTKTMSEWSKISGTKVTTIFARISRGKTEKEAVFGKVGRNISVLQLSKDGEVINKWSSIREASKITSINESSISTALSGKHKSAGGYVWKYAEKIS